MVGVSDSDYNKYLKAIDAIKDILYMYRELIGYNGLFDDFGVEDGVFDPTTYIDISPQDVELGDDDIKLLHEGSAIKIICSVLQAWCQGGYPDTVTQYLQDIKKLLGDGRLRHLPELESLLSTAFKSDEDAWDASRPIYEKYVKGYFKTLAD